MGCESVEEVMPRAWRKTSEMENPWPVLADNGQGLRELRSTAPVTGIMLAVISWPELEMPLYWMGSDSTTMRIGAAVAAPAAKMRDNMLVARILNGVV